MCYTANSFVTYGVYSHYFILVQSLVGGHTLFFLHELWLSVL